MLPIRNMSYLLPMCCSFWEKCKNSPKTGLGCSTPLKHVLCLPYAEDIVHVPMDNKSVLNTNQDDTRLFMFKIWLFGKKKKEKKKQYNMELTPFSINLETDHYKFWVLIIMIQVSSYNQQWVNFTGWSRTKLIIWFPHL